MAREYLGIGAKALSYFFSSTYDHEGNKYDESCDFDLYARLLYSLLSYLSHI